MKAWNASALALIAAIGLTASAYADHCCPSKHKAEKAVAKAAVKDKASCSKPCDSKQVAVKADCEIDCTGKKLIATGMPLLHYKVGDQQTACPVQAKAYAKKHEDAKVKYVVNDRAYCDKGEAMQAYAKNLDNYLEQITTVRYAVGDQCMRCPASAASLAKKHNTSVKFRVASYDFDTRSHADDVISKARKAAESVKVKTVVDGKTYECTKVCTESCAAADCAEKCAVSCDKPCGDKKAVKVAGKSQCDKPCDGDKARTVAAKDKQCDSAKARKVASKDKQCDKPCDSDKARTVAAKDDCSKTCDKDANKMARNSDGRYWLIGDFKTCCPLTAKVRLAQARVQAAHAAIASANGDAELAQR